MSSPNINIRGGHVQGNSKFSIDAEVAHFFEGDATYDWAQDKLAKTKPYHKYIMVVRIKEDTEPVIELELDERKEASYSIAWETQVTFGDFFNLARGLYGQRIKEQKASVGKSDEGGILIREQGRPMIKGGRVGEYIERIAKGIERDRFDYDLTTFLRGNVEDIVLPTGGYLLIIRTPFFKAYYDHKGKNTIAFRSQFNMADSLADLFSTTSIRRYEQKDIGEIGFILRQLLGRYPS